MKITATRKEDILRQKAEYEERKKAYDARQAEYQRRYDEAEEAVLGPIRDFIENQLSKFNLLGFEVRVETYFREGIRVNIYCNEREKFSPTSALSWSYEAKIDGDGEVKQETNSWSGLQATTKEQLDSLKQTVEALELINSWDWKTMLNKEVPNYRDYYDMNDRIEPRPNFEAQLLEAELEDLVGTNKLILVQPFESAWYNGQEYVQLVRETPKQYEVRQYPYYKRFKGPDADDQTLEEFRKDLEKNGMTVRVAKKNIVPVKPIKILEA